MSNVVSINGRRRAGPYAPRGGRAPEGAARGGSGSERPPASERPAEYGPVGGRLADDVFTFVLMICWLASQAAVCAYGGLAPSLALAGVALAGAGLGAIRYRRPPVRLGSLFGDDGVPQTPPREDVPEAKAA